MDLFFYREPEEAKEQEEEVPAIADYADYSASAALGGDWTSSQIPEAQWTADAAAPAVGGGWAGDGG